jgi:hypothetical protein|tara:strand:- start:1797 stop:2786 length:990 start_codon:yes stop_codon:yes gene_type:complete
MSNRGRKVVPKSQKEISKGLHTPFSKEEGNPNNAAYQKTDRSNQVSFKGDTVKPFTVGLYDIDETILYYFNNVIKPTVVQNGKRVEVPVIYADSERWNQIQKNGYFRDKKGRIMMPLITFKRTNIEKNRNITNKLDANFPNNYRVYEKSYSANNTYDKFNILNDRRPTKAMYAVVVPDYVTLNYDCIISTYYVEQMNGIVEAINYASDSYWGNPERYQFRARIDSVSTNVEMPADQDRVVKSTFSIKMYGYIVPNILQKDLSSIQKYNSKAKITFNPEMVSNIDEVESSPPKRTNIEHGDFTGFVDPPSTRVPSNRINTNRVPPTINPD